MAHPARSGTVREVNETLETSETPVPPEDDRRTFRPLAVVKLVAAVTIVALLATAAGQWLASPSGRLEMTPGPTWDLSAGLSADTLALDTLTAHDRGRFLLTTVQAAMPSRKALLTGQHQTPDDAVVVQVPPDWGKEQARAGSTRRIESEQAAARTAFELAGLTPPPLVGVQIAAVQPGSRAERAGLREGQVITAADGRELVSAEIDPTVRTVSVQHVGDVELDPPTTDGELIGLAIVEVRPSPFQVELAEVGGSSGGLMLTLTMLDALGPGDLTAGMTVAGTGALGPEGAVTAVSGIPAKIRAAADDGAAVMFVPQGLADDAAIEAAGDRIELVEVERVSDAVAWLCAAGADDAACA